jgi:hypothetical protein
MEILSTSPKSTSPEKANRHSVKYLLKDENEKPKEDVQEPSSNKKRSERRAGTIGHNIGKIFNSMRRSSADDSSFHASDDHSYNFKRGSSSPPLPTFSDSEEGTPRMRSRQLRRYDSAHWDETRTTIQSFIQNRPTREDLILRYIFFFHNHEK